MTRHCNFESINWMSKKKNWPKFAFFLFLVVVSNVGFFLLGRSLKINSLLVTEPIAPSNRSLFPWEEESQSDWKTFESKTMGVSFKHPSSWQVHYINEEKNSINMGVSSYFEESANIVYPNGAGFMQMNRIRCVQPELKQCKTVTEYAAEWMKGIDHLKQSQVLVDNKMGLSFEGYRIEMGGNYAYAKSVLVPVGDDVFVIGVANKDTFPILEEILETLEFK